MRSTSLVDTPGLTPVAQLDNTVIGTPVCVHLLKVYHVATLSIYIFTFSGDCTKQDFQHKILTMFHTPYHTHHTGMTWHYATSVHVSVW